MKKKIKYTLETLPKYVSSEDIEKLTREERQELYKQCSEGGRTCYVDNEAPFDMLYNEYGDINIWVDLYDY